MWFQRLVEVDESNPELTLEPAEPLLPEQPTTSKSGVRAKKLLVATPADFQRVRLLSTRRKTTEKVHGDPRKLDKPDRKFEQVPAELRGLKREPSISKREAADACVDIASKPEVDQSKRIKFKDALGRNFSFPLHLCEKWAVSLPHSFEPPILS
jgi:hypothetical protein